MSKHILIEAKETASQVNMIFKKPSLRYLDELVGLKCGSDLLALGLFPNAKEITESFSAFNAVRRNLARMGLKGPEAFGRRDINLVVVGDGNTPRTAATFAFRTRWACWSIDPRMKLKWYGFDPKGVQHLIALREKIEDCPLTFDAPTIIIAVHSHADLTVSVNAITAPVRHVVAIPCCMPQALAIAPSLEYDDWGIHSPERTVKVWFNV